MLVADTELARDLRHRPRPDQFVKRSTAHLQHVMFPLDRGPAAAERCHVDLTGSQFFMRYGLSSDDARCFCEGAITLEAASFASRQVVSRKNIGLEIKLPPRH